MKSFLSAFFGTLLCISVILAVAANYPSIADPSVRVVPAPAPIVSKVEATVKTPPITFSDLEIVATVPGLKVGDNDKIPVGNLVTLEAFGANPEDFCLWDIRYPGNFEQFAEEGKKLFIAMPAEDVGITLLVIPADFPNASPRKVRSVLKADVTKLEPKPDDKEQEVKPNPPKPSFKISAIVVLEDRQKLNEAARNIRMSETWRILSKTKDIVKKASWYDVDNPEAAKYKEVAEKVGLPAVLLFNEDGEFENAVPLPPTEQQFKELFN